MFGLLRSMITYLVPPPKTCAPRATSVEDTTLSDATISPDNGNNGQHAKQEEETYRAQLKFMAESASSLKIDADTADTDNVSDAVTNGQIDLEWEQRNGSGRTRRRGNRAHHFSAAADRLRWEIQEFRFAKRQEEQRQEEKKKELDDNLEAVSDKIVELDGMVAFWRDMGAKQPDKKQADTKQTGDHNPVSAYVDSRVEDLREKTQDEIDRLKTEYKDLSDKCNESHASNGTMKDGIAANKKSCDELRGRIYVLEHPVPIRKAEVANLEAVATPIAGTEQPQAKTRGYDPKKVSALTAKTEGHDQQIERLETAISDISPKMEQAFEWHEWAGKKFQEYDSSFSEGIENKFKEIQAAEEQQGQRFNEALTSQKEVFEKQLRQQKEDSDKELGNQRESMQQEMRLHEASIRKECEERLALKDKEVAERLAKIDAEQKEQKERNDSLERTMKDFIAQFKVQSAIQQPATPAQVQQSPVARPLQPTPATGGSVPWPSAPTPWASGQQLGPRTGAKIGDVPDLDDNMEDAPSLHPQQPTVQPPRQPVQPNSGALEDTPMSSGEPMIPNINGINGNVGFLANSQPINGFQPFSGTGPAQPPPSGPIPSPAPVRGQMAHVWRNPAASGFVPSSPASTVPDTPTDRLGARVQPSLLGPDTSGPRILAGQVSLPSLTATPARAPAPQKLDLNAPPPDWSSFMDLDGDDVMSLPAKPKQPSIKVPPATPQAGQQAASTPVPTATNAAGPSSSVSGPSPGPAKPQAPATTKPSAPKPKKKPDPFIKRKPATTPRKTPTKPNDVTTKAQTMETDTPKLSLAEQRKAFLAGDFSSFPHLPKKATVEKPKKTDTSMPSPASTRMTPPPEPRASPLANSAATSGSIETPSTTNIFTKEVKEPVKQPSERNFHSTPEEPKVKAGNTAAGVTDTTKPADNTDDIQMSEAESKPEPTKPLKYEADFNPRKHAAAVQIVPQEDAKTVKRETQDDAKAHKGDSQGDAEVEMGNSQDDAMASKQGPQDDDHMDTDRRVAKPKGKAASMTAADRQRQTKQFQEEAAWDAMEKAMAHDAAQKDKAAAAAAADDEVDYGDPNDANDEDLTTTTMSAPLPKVRPTKYSIAFFNEWRRHFMSTNSLSSKAASFKCRTKEDFEAFASEVQKHDGVNDLGDLLGQAKLPLKKTQGYTSYEMQKLIFTYREEVYFQALNALDLDDIDPDLIITHERFKAEVVSWFRDHSPDTV